MKGNAEDILNYQWKKWIVAMEISSARNDTILSARVQDKFNLHRTLNPFKERLLEIQYYL